MSDNKIQNDKQMKNVNYTRAIEELETIVSEMENENITVDELSEKVKRAAELIRLCKAVLHKTEEEVDAILKEMGQEMQDN
jgi:exodeoxyribonuclease VII small subunit